MSLVLLNPRAAGGRAAAMASPLSQWLSAHAPRTALRVVDGVADALALIEAQPAGSRVVLVGGDGTVHRMLPALLSRGCELGLVPMGSGNDAARALGLAFPHAQAALAHALSAPARRIDLGECRLQDAQGSARVLPFLSSLAAGFDAAVGARALTGPRWLRGQPRYLWATLRELIGLRSSRLCLRVDGRALHAGEALFASVLNTPTYGAGMPATPQARIDDGRLDLLVAGAFGRWAALAMLPRLLAGRHLSHARVATHPLIELDAQSEVPLPLAGDGEPAGYARQWRIRVMPRALAVVGAARLPAERASPISPAA